ncbi:MAG: hypothetical protein ACO20G_01920 [Ilumatobacteraceae bacterium]|nr:hypothetical protein [Actinomycetota bacterium]
MSDDLHDDPEQMRLDDDIVAALRDPSPIDEVARRRAVRAAVATRYGGARWMRPLSAAAAVVVVALAGVVLVRGGGDVDMMSAPAATTRTATNSERAVADMAAELGPEEESAADGGAASEMADVELDDADLPTDDADAATSALMADEQPASTAVAAAEVPEAAAAEPAESGDDAPMSVLPLIMIDTIEDLAAAGRMALGTDDTVVTDCAAVGERAITFAIVNDVDAVLVITADASMVRAVAAESCDVILSTSIAP